MDKNLNLYNNIPAELQQLPQWGVYKKIWQEDRQKYTKIPYSAVSLKKASSTNPNDWCAYHQAIVILSSTDFDGLGFCFVSGYIGIDIDHIVPNGQKVTEATLHEGITGKIYNICKSYTEISLSGTGIHIIISGKMPGNKHRREPVEMYETGRFFAITGDIIGEYKDINHPSEEVIKELYTTYLEPKPHITHENISDIVPDNVPTVSDAAIVRQITKSPQGKNFDLFMDGGWEKEYPSASEADLSFCNMLAYWTHGRIEQMDRLFRQSSLMRDKWDSLRGDSTYGDITIDKAVASWYTEKNKKQHNQLTPSNVNNTFVDENGDIIYNGLYAPADLNTILVNTHHTFDITLDWTKYKIWERNMPGICKRFIERWGDICQYNTPTKMWYIFTGKMWEIDSNDYIGRLVFILMDSLKNEEPSDENLSPQEKNKWINFLTNGNIIRLVTNNIMKGITYHEFNKDPKVLNMKNGSLDLVTQKFSVHNAKDYFDQITNITFDKNAKCPKWIKFIHKLFNNDTELINYVQVALGYTLLGAAVEGKMFMLFGPGRNGKSVFVNVLESIFKDYANDIHSSVLLSNRHGGNDTNTINDRLSQLKYTRLVVCNESNENDYFNEPQLKILTGGDKLQERPLYGHAESYAVKFKIWFATNYRPIIQGLDIAIWSRIVVIPCPIFLPPEQRDSEFHKKLEAEASGIFNWIFEGCIKYQQDGLKEPEIIKKSRKEYQDLVNPITTFLDEWCIRDEAAITSSQILFNAYKNWQMLNNGQKLSNTKFGKLLSTQFKREKKNIIYYLGIRLKDKFED